MTRQVKIAWRSQAFVKLWNKALPVKQTCKQTSKTFLRCLTWKSTAGFASFLWKPNCRSPNEKDRRSQTSNETRKTSLSVNSSSIVFPLRFTGRFSRANLDDLNSPYSSFLINIVPRLLLFPPFLNKIQSEYLPSASSSLENISWHLTNKPLPPPQEHRNTFMAPSRLTRWRKKNLVHSYRCHLVPECLAARYSPPSLRRPWDKGRCSSLL